MFKDPSQNFISFFHPFVPLLWVYLDQGTQEVEPASFYLSLQGFWCRLAEKNRFPSASSHKTTLGGVDFR
jgi:hypothetical protein